MRCCNARPDTAIRDTAIRENQLRLHYQPKFDLHTQRVTGFEALLRWQHPKLGMIYPDTFIPLAEVSDIIHPLTLEVINLAFKQQNEWLKVRTEFFRGGEYFCQKPD